MSDVIYAVRIGRLTYSGLSVWDVKIGKTKNIDSTIAQYRRSHRDLQLLDLWQPNNELSISDCEKGVHELAEKYAYQRDNEKFIFLQNEYEAFSKNVSLLLKKTSTDRTKKGKMRKERKVAQKPKIEYTGSKPKLVTFNKKSYRVNTWREVLMVVAKQIYLEKNDFNKVLTIKGRKRLYFSKNCKKKQKGGELINPIRILGTPYCFEGNESANSIVKITHKLIETFGYNSSDLKVEYE